MYWMNVPIVLMNDGNFTCIVGVNTLAIDIMPYVSLGSYRFCAKVVVDICSDRIGG